MHTLALICKFAPDPIGSYACWENKRAGQKAIDELKVSARIAQGRSIHSQSGPFNRSLGHVMST